MMYLTRIVASALCLALAPSMAHSGPIYLEESGRIVLPDLEFPESNFIVSTQSPPAVSGDSVVLIARRFQAGEFGDDEIVHAAFLFERRASDDAWPFVAKLLETVQDAPRNSDSSEMTVAIDGNRMIINARDKTAGVFRRVYERGASGWTHVADLVAPAGTEDQGRDSEMDGDTVALGISGRSTQGATAYRRNAQGVWTYIGAAEGPASECMDDCDGPDLDISGNTMAFTVIGPFDGQSHAEIWNYAGGTTWSPVASVPDPSKPVDIADAIAIEDDTVLLGAHDKLPTNGPFRLGPSNILEYRRLSGAWSLADEVRSDDAFINGDIAAIELEGGLAAVAYPRDDMRGPNAGSLAVYRRGGAGRFEEVARLVTSDAHVGQQDVAEQMEISGRRIVATYREGAYVFDLPTSLSQPATVQDDFEDGNSTGWTSLPGSTWSVVTSGGSKVFRQSNLGALDGALLGSTDWTNQAIEVDVKPTAISGSDRWVGLAVRYKDASNYYYVTLRSSNRVEIRRMAEGTFQPLASVSYPFTLGRSYRLRLEAIGSWLSVYIDGQAVVSSLDAFHKQGQAALLTSRARADFDNAIVSPNWRLTMMADKFEDEAGAYRWSPGLTSDWAVTTDGTKVYSQRSTVGDARSITGVATRDQIVRTRAKATAFNGADRWFGVMTRFVDDQNYYYVTVRNSNQISLRKLVNGVAHVLDTAPMTVGAGTWYDLKMESVGNLHRVYVNDVLWLEASDSTHAAGRYGFRTFRAAAAYDDFTAVKP